MAFDIYQTVTDSIIEALEQNIVPWRKPWREDIAGGGFHRSIKGRPYRGINQALLGLVAMQKGYTSPFWMTYKACQEAGGSIIQHEEKGKRERGTMVVFNKKVVTKDRTTGEAKTFWLARYFTVFNVEQTVGVEVPDLELRGEDFDPIKEAEAMVANIEHGPRIKHGGQGAFYSPAADTITMPAKRAFKGKAEKYYGTLFHELAHATGHESRLNREEIKDANFGTQKYAREELVAEMASAMLLSTAGIAPDYEQSAAYISSWLRALKNDKRLVVTAGSRAWRATEWVLGTAVDYSETETTEDASSQVLVAA